MLLVLIYLPFHGTYALIAQLDRVTGYEPVGRGFESLSARQQNGNRFSVSVLFFMLITCMINNNMIY